MASLRNANNIPISAETIVRDGLTARERIAIAERDPRALAAFDNFDAADRTRIFALCDQFKARHGHKFTSKGTK